MCKSSSVIYADNQTTVTHWLPLYRQNHQDISQNVFHWVILKFWTTQGWTEFLLLGELSLSTDGSTGIAKSWQGASPRWPPNTVSCLKGLWQWSHNHALLPSIFNRGSDPACYESNTAWDGAYRPALLSPWEWFEGVVKMSRGCISVPIFYHFLFSVTLFLHADSSFAARLASPFSIFFICTTRYQDRWCNTRTHGVWICVI